ncbi:Anhydro-N-acetylmuramic acid kinase [Chitinispirillum alkaliphilum]|nr:Anhydro-N-acetylmuramic acid kinase [Chitinispirillum alkaliphilum]
MSADIQGKLKRKKNRRILIISAGGIQSGIQALYIGTENGSWNIHSKAFIPYPKKVGTLIGKLIETQDPITPSELAWLEYKTTMLFLESATAALAQAPKAIGKPHFVVLNKLTLWKGKTGENLQQSNWNLTVGDAQFVASSLNLPVFTDFIRHNILAGGPGVLPLFPGILKISKQVSGPAVFVNIGLLSRITIIDNDNSTLITESDSGPGTILVDKCAQAADSPDGFDRDGNLSQKGVVNTESLETLSSEPWFKKPAPKHSSIDSFLHLLEKEEIKSLDPIDRVATITALTAKTIFDFYTREYPLKTNPGAVWISGGGSNNLAIINYLSAYFDPIPIRTIEELGVPADVKIPLALGLSVDTFISGNSVPWETGNNPVIKPLARWITP